MDANTVTAIAAVASFTVILATAIIYGMMLRDMKKTRQLDSILIILRCVDDMELRRARWFLYQHHKRFNNMLKEPFFWENRNDLKHKVEEMSNGMVTLEKIDLLVNALNNIAFLVLEGYAPEDIGSKFLNTTFLRSWKVLRPYIEFRRVYRMGLPPEVESKYGKKFQDLVNRLVHDFSHETQELLLSGEELPDDGVKPNG